MHGQAHRPALLYQAQWQTVQVFFVTVTSISSFQMRNVCNLLCQVSSWHVRTMYVPRTIRSHIQDNAPEECYEL